MNTQAEQTYKERPVSEEHPELFHYTRMDGLRGILETNRLWATHASHLNDSSELMLLWPKLKEVCIAQVEKAISRYAEHNPDRTDEITALGGPAELASKDGATFVDIMRSLLFGNNESPGMAIPFVSSFSTHRNEHHCEHGMLSQWRGYAGDDGVAIVFNTKQLEDLLRAESDQFKSSRCVLQEAVYLVDEVDLRGQFSVLFHAVELFADHLIGGLDPEEGRVQKNTECLQMELFAAATRLKHFAFQEEQECRIVVGVPHREHHAALGILAGDGQAREIHHRPSSSGSVPYIRLFEGIDKKLPISRILIGPSRNQEANFEMACDLISRHYKDENIQIKKSEIPYVSST